MGTRVYGEKERFIPTHVGNTAVAKAISDVLVVHPHACGEHSWASPLATIRTGSSPRMWGTLYQGYGERDCKRFIPTHVGNTLSPMIISAMRAVHPHACGEHTSVFEVIILQPGSSPRMWGTPHCFLNNGLRVRFIPTHVGNTPNPAPLPSGNTVHPHACGEHYKTVNLMNKTGGSSPRMWGTRRNPLCLMVSYRFIPTHVGNTPPRFSWPRWHPVHPHACGEHLFDGIKGDMKSGSSPRMWGTHSKHLLWCYCLRFIPTHVGNTLRPTTSAGHEPVHPHACGEHGGDYGGGATSGG